MNVSIIICTRNRAKLLDQTLTGMHRLRVSNSITWEVVVVDNGSPDDTDAVVARHKAVLPLRRVFEPRPGEMHAWNAAVGAARGNLIISTADDVLVHPEWVSAYLRAAWEWPRADYFGGTVTPRFERTPPRWVRDNLPLLGEHYAIAELGPETRPFGPGEGPVRANLAFRRRVSEVLQADSDGGFVDDCQFRGEECDAPAGLTGGNGRGVWVGPARVEHVIPSEQMTPRWIWNYSHDQGRGFMRSGRWGPCSTLLGVPRWVIRQYCQLRGISLGLSPLRNRRWLQARLQAALYRGVIAEARSTGRVRATATHPACSGRGEVCMTGGPADGLVGPA